MALAISARSTGRSSPVRSDGHRGVACEDLLDSDQMPYSSEYFRRRVAIRGRWSGFEPVTCSIKFRGPVALAFAMDLRAQPAEQAAEVTPREGFIEAAELGLGLRRRAGPRRDCPACRSENSR